MKRIKTKLDDILTIENLMLANERILPKKKHRSETLIYNIALGTLINDLYNELKTGTFHISPYCVFTVHEPKTRDILQPHYRDLIVQRLVYDAVYDDLEKKLYKHTYGVRKNRGMHHCSRQVQKRMRDDSSYLQIDMRKFFFSIDKDILRKQLERLFKDTKLIDLIMQFTSCDEKGIPIGNLLSGILGMIYLTPLDMFIKKDLKIKNYYRFMDDAVLLNVTKEQSKDYRERIKKYLCDNLGLSLSKSNIKDNIEGVNFVGFRTKPFLRLVRKRTIKNYRKGDEKSRISIMGMCKNTFSERYLLSIPPYGVAI